MRSCHYYNEKILLTLITLLVFFSNAQAQGVEDKWNIAKGTHFVLYYKEASPEFIDKVLDRAEYYYNEIADDLGFTRFNFWLWDERAKIYIYTDADDYTLNTAQPRWSSGYASIKEKTIKTYPLAQSFFDRLLPHELGHIIFREFVGFDNRGIPLWLDEGVATYQEKIKRMAAKRYVREAIKNNKFIPLDKLSSINLSAIEDKETVEIFYLESVSLIYYLITEFGKDSFVSFCRALRDTKTLPEAIMSVYHFSNLEELNNGWVAFLKNE